MRAETSAEKIWTRRHPVSQENHDKGRGSLRLHITNLYGEKVFKQSRRLCQLREKKELRLCQLTFLQRCRDTNILPKFVHIKCHIRTPAANRILKNSSFAMLRERIKHTRWEISRIEEELYSLHLQLSSKLNKDDWQKLDSISMEHAKHLQHLAKLKQIKKFEHLLSLQQRGHKQDIPQKTVINLSKKHLDEDTHSILEKGLNFSVAPTKIPFEEIITGVEAALHTMNYEEADHIRHKTREILLHAKPPKPNISKGEKQALEKLKKNKDIVALKADKGNATVILDTEDYNKKALEILNNRQYKELPKNPLKSHRNSYYYLRCHKEEA